MVIVPVELHPPATVVGLRVKMMGGSPSTLIWNCVPTYTFPFATVGTVNFTPGPRVSRPGTMFELYSMFCRLAASYAYRSAGFPVFFTLQTIPLAVPLALTLGVEPG